MKARFWKALESLGSSGSARCDWQQCLGEDWDDCARFLRSTGRVASTVINPQHPPHRLALMVDGADDFVAVDEDPSIPPVPVKAHDAAEMQPHWDSIARALADAVGFDYGAWENSGHIRRIGSS
ncbi:MAG: hypothetical protein ACO3RV_10390, partial [Luteolibacter sp.]